MNTYGINFDAPHPMFPKVPFRDLTNYYMAHVLHKEEIMRADLERNPFCMKCGVGVAFPKLARAEDHKTGEHKGFLCLSCFGPKYDQSGFPLL